jgi:hypothetical protein
MVGLTRKTKPTLRFLLSHRRGRTGIRKTYHMSKLLKNFETIFNNKKNKTEDTLYLKKLFA